FFSHLVKLPAWRTMPVAEAAQRVQHSADGSAYQQWEERARALARALTGEVPAGLSCKWSDRPEPRQAALSAAASAQIGRDWATGSSDASRDWTVAEWLVAHSYDYGVVAVAARGQRWTAASGRWEPDA